MITEDVIQAVGEQGLLDKITQDDVVKYVVYRRGHEVPANTFQSMLTNGYLHEVAMDRYRLTEKAKALLVPGRIVHYS